MSPLDQVLAAAKRISDEGRAPTLALIKTKLGTSIPMRVLIQGLQQFKSMNAEDIAALSAQLSITEVDSEPEKIALGQTQKIEKLEQELAELRLEFSLLKTQFSQLESRLVETKGYDN
ncbi:MULTISPECIES: hypothetical protein [unclassified Shewanella]|uniref:hypothetical protein n=1 Tax=unclassified Shewanella TaxID=196818 RepID=UPI001BBBB6B2|nr:MULTISPECIES: hypothetical protein [unclassified Shewanella]GIU16681.1 hypothetical protein TUM4444_29670 [Shewanella sp. MBTL60-112-B1]GIU35803.1 hypothetical protein TUM4445_26080 [Shewanella sp. MBTL60-112-B2]